MNGREFAVGMLIGLAVGIVANVLDWLTKPKGHWQSIRLVKGEDENLYGVPTEGHQTGEDFIFRCEKCWGLSEIETPFCPKCGRRMKMDE